MNEKGERVKKVREILKKNRQEFSAAIGISASNFANIENGYRDLTDRNAEAIRRVFNVNSEWLKTGEGEMFLPSTGNKKLDELCNEYQLDGLARQVLERFLMFPPTQRVIISDWTLKTFDFIEELAEELQNKRAERKKQLEAAVAAGKDAEKELAEMEEDERSSLVKDTLNATG